MRSRTPSYETDAPVETGLLLEFLDRSILRERRLEALWKRASRGPFAEDFREELEFEAYEDREHARILRRHRSTVARNLGAERRAPGSRASKMGRTFSPAAALAEALSIKAASRAEYAGMVRFLEDRYLRKFVDVLAGSEDRALPRLLDRARHYGIRPRAPEAERAERMRPVSPTLLARHATALSVA
jgi:hypothetical protein